MRSQSIQTPAKSSVHPSVSSRSYEAQSSQSLLTSAATKSLRRHDDVILFAFAQQKMFSEQQVVRGDSALEICFAGVINVHAAAFDVLPRLAFGRTQPRVSQQLDQRQAAAAEFRFLDFLRRNFAENFAERLFGNPVQRRTKQNGAGAKCFGSGRIAVNQPRDFGRENGMRRACAGILRVLSFQ